MTLTQAFTQFTASQQYKDIAKQNNSEGSRYRTCLHRFNKGELKAGAIVEMLVANGYEITAKQTVKKK